MSKWFKMYPNCCHTLLNNTEELDSTFEEFHDYTSISTNEKQSMQEGKTLLRKLMMDDLEN